MSISDAQFTAWLLSDNKSRVVLVEANAYSGGTQVTRYFSDRGFVSTPSDTPANTAYDDILLSVTQIRSVLAEAFIGRSIASTGDLVIDNSSGVRDSWLTDSWDGREIKMYLGDAAWPKSDFRTVFVGTIKDISSTGTNSLTLSIRDKQHLLTVPVQANRVGGTGPAKDSRIPLAYGEVKSVRPVLIDAALHKYQWHDGQVQSVDAVYDNGKSIAGYTADLTTGTITLTSAPAGTITLDGKGSKTGGVYVNKIGDIAARLITERSSITSGSIDSATLAQLNTAAPGVAGIYIDEDNATVADALDSVLAAAGGYYVIDRTGKVALGLFAAPGGTPVLTITDDDLVLSQLSLAKRIVPLKSVRVGYERYNETISYGADTTLTEAQRQRLAQEYLVAYAATAGAANFLLAVDGDLAGTPYVLSSDAATEATRRAALWGVLRRVFTIPGFLAPQQVKLGDVVSLDLSRYGLSGGVLARVVSLTENLTNNRISMDVFV